MSRYLAFLFKYDVVEGVLNKRWMSLVSEVPPAARVPNVVFQSRQPSSSISSTQHVFSCCTACVSFDSHRPSTLARSYFLRLFSPLGRLVIGVRREMGQPGRWQWTARTQRWRSQMYEGVCTQSRDSSSSRLAAAFAAFVQSINWIALGNVGSQSRRP